MAAHLRPLSACRTCGKPATQMLYNAVNAPCGEYCNRCAKPALRKFIESKRTRDKTND